MTFSNPPLDYPENCGCCLKHGGLRSSGGFESMMTLCVTIVTLLTVVIGQFHHVVLDSVLFCCTGHFDPTRWDFAWSSRWKDIVSGLIFVYFLITAPTVDFFSLNLLFIVGQFIVVFFRSSILTLVSCDSSLLLVETKQLSCETYESSLGSTMTKTKGLSKATMYISLVLVDKLQ